MKISYFAWIKTKIGTGEETIEFPKAVTTIEQLLNWLEQKGMPYREAFKNRAVVKVAVNQQHVTHAHPVTNNDELSIFPPISGG